LFIIAYYAAACSWYAVVSSDSRLYVATENDKTYANAQLKRFNACC